MIVGSDVIRYALSSGGFILILLIVSLWVTRSAGSRRSRRAMLVVTVAFAVISIYAGQFLLAQAIVGLLRPFSSSDAIPNRRTAVVILGSGSVGVEDWDGRRYSLPDRPAMARVLEAARVFRLVDPALVISSGGSPRPERRMTPTGETMREMLLVLGVPSERILVETVSRTTRDEAVVIAPMLREQHVEQVILVTSEEHMRRSVGTFRAVGIDVVPAIARDLRRDVTWMQRWLPGDEGLGTASENAHEILGIVYYAMRGWWR
jgi:uncharacterized SAM-binding protein YcdF (DUF218 family)